MPDLVMLVERTGPVLGFLLALTIVAEIADRAGVFDIAGHWCARAAHGSVLRLWLLVVALATLATIVLSLDTTAVLLTPVVLAIAKVAGLERRVFALTTVWLANTASLLLPVSNLTNLLALHHVSRLHQQGGPTGGPSYLGLMWRPAIAAVLATIVVTWLLHRRTLRGRFETTEPAHQHDPVLVRVSALVCIALGPLFVSGITPVIPAAVAAVVLLAVLAWRDREGFSTLHLPGLTILAVVVLFVLVDIAGRAGLTALLLQVAGRGSGVGDLLRLAAVSAGLANLGNNLPSYLALEPVAGSAHRIAAVLVGVNAGSIVTPWGSVATLLWAGRCRRADAPVNWGVHLWQSAVVAVACVLAATVAIVL
ncbi:SLC13 family permease [Aestuariimicrobium kwangyangense]|uniref:SLC13 family permease n=1 Tax=Aestuariimicrobium kwangyangense TaxID=396389 RepID=UPI0003B6BDF7|nr:SLC13 family permease [Aestuariimicrobium kwangyangense]